jgi:hypothetical protein
VKKAGWRGVIWTVSLLFAGCRSALPPSAPSGSKPPGAIQPGTNSALATTNAVEQRGTWHSVKVTPRPGQPKIHFCDKLNPIWWFKNLDDPVPPASYRPDDKRRVTKWYFRNPLHNFNFYVIGIADKEFVRSGRYPERNSNPNGGWTFAVSRRKCLLLPFISYNRRRFHFYFGWRERGNFGFKLNRSTPHAKPKNEE